CPTRVPIPTDVMPPPDSVGTGTPPPTLRPTYTPYPTPTPYVIRPPQDFYAGDAVHTGGWASEVNARFRLDDITTVSASLDDDGTARALVTWTLEVKNLGNIPYEFFPAAQAFISQVETPTGPLTGIWGAGEEAAAEAGVAFEYAAYSLGTGETLALELAAYIPAGEPAQFTYLLDPTQTTKPNTITWTHETNPACSGDVLDPGAGGLLPTPQ
ncbi:MAG: hypothetical protein AAF125_22195, partial [Chloroflexota bacterium]